MYLIYLLFALFNFSLYVYGNDETVPVFLWSNNKLPTRSGLKTYTSVAFDELLHDALNVDQPVIVAFLEENLSNEDFNLRSQDNSPTYKALKNAANKRHALYLPSVVFPTKALDVLREENFDVIQYNGKLPTDLSGPSLLIVQLEEDSDKERSQLLRSHTIKMQQIYNEISKQHSNVFAIYTGKRSSLSANVVKRFRRADAPTENTGLLIRAGPVVIVANSISFRTSHDADPVIVTGATVASVDNGTSLSIKVNLLPSGVATFNLTSEQGDTPASSQWQLLNVQLEDKTLVPAEPVWAPRGWSWACSGVTAFTASRDNKGPNPTYDGSLNITGLQLQPDIDETKYAFGHAIDCVPYFSIAIWTGISISVLLLFILSFGLIMIMDINSNDRFDDPKGKTITINATD